MAENTTGLGAGMNTTGLGAGMNTTKMPGHLLLARLGKRVLRPGGRELTGRLLDAVDLDHADRVVELGPGACESDHARRPAVDRANGP